MPALYEDVEKFFGDIFAAYGRFVATYPIVFIVLSLFANILLGLGLLNVRYENDVEKLYTPMGSPASNDRSLLEQRFADNTSSSFYNHQLIFHSTYAEFLFVPKDGEVNNILTPEAMAEIKILYDQVHKITLTGEDDRGMTLDKLCARRKNLCVIDGAVLLENFIRDGCLNTSDVEPYVCDETGHLSDIHDTLSGVTTENHCLKAKALRIRFNLNHDTDNQRELSMAWERAFIEHLHTCELNSVDVSYAVSESLDIELADHLGQDTKYFSLTIVIMVVYAVFVSGGGNWVSSRMLLAQAGILAALLAIVAAFGMLTMCGVVFVDICGVMPFLILGVGVDDMFILMSGWRQTDMRLSVEDRMSDTFRTSAISVTITSLTDLLAFCIGATSPFLSVKNFCFYAGVAVFFCYINQLTFFAGCMTLQARRVLDSRHCVTCLKTQPRKVLEEAGFSRAEITCCHGHPPGHKGEDDSLCEKLPSTALPKFLLKLPTKIFVIVLFVCYLGISVWGAAQIKTGLKLENVVPDTSYLSKYMHKHRTFFEHSGPSVMFVITEPVRYDSEETQAQIREILTLAKESGFISSLFKVSWVDHFSHYLRNRTPSERPDSSRYLSILRTEFLEEHPEYKNDIVFSDTKQSIVSSRVYIRSKQMNDSTTEGNMMIRMREIALNSPLPALAFSTEFIYYEHYVSIMKNTLLAVGVAIIGMLFIALMFIPHPISITCVTITMITIVLGMFAFMHFWGLELSAITNVQIILSVGFCVDFTVHISHAFMTASGKNRNERVRAALEKVGTPILNGGLSSILGILVLAFARSYAFRSFFKTMLLVIILGLFHAMVLLPVLLSFVGPRRTSKPRVFIPVSAHWREGLHKPFVKHHSVESVKSDDTAPAPDKICSAANDDNAEQMELIQMELPAWEQRRLLQQHLSDNDDEIDAAGLRRSTSPQYYEKREDHRAAAGIGSVVEVSIEHSPSREALARSYSPTTPSSEDPTTMTSISDDEMVEEADKTFHEDPEEGPSGAEFDRMKESKT